MWGRRGGHRQGRDAARVLGLELRGGSGEGRRNVTAYVRGF